jgi:hypothetical protein
VPNPLEADERLFLISIRSSLRVVARMPLPDGDVCRVTWPSASRLLVVLSRGAACYSAIDSALVMVIDPLRARVIAQHSLSGSTTVIASAPTGSGLALLLTPARRRSAARIVLATATEVRTIRFDRLREGTRAIGLRGYRLGGSPQLHALDGRPVIAAPGQGRYVYAAGPGPGDVSVIDLSDGRVEPPDPGAISVSSFELLVGGSP